MIKKLFLFILFLVLCSACLTGLSESAASPWLCLSCGNETTGESCPACGALRGQWYCDVCRIANLSDACLQCGKARDQMLAEQAEDPRPYFAWPAVRFLADSGLPASLFRLGAMR